VDGVAAIAEGVEATEAEACFDLCRDSEADGTGFNLPFSFKRFMSLWVNSLVKALILAFLSSERVGLRWLI
jgi:hypothetical protein